jgi:D-arabinose 1-dehydrogenase-like Zn-dependent alcohol dehydrogenase
VKGIVVTAYGAPLEQRELAEPTLRPGHALLEVLTCGVCFSDVKIARGKMPFSADLPLPHVPGHEICGRVLATDPAGALEPGTTVVVYNVWPCGRCDRCRAGEEQICRNPRARAGFTDPGGFQERMVVPLDRVLAVPEGLDPFHAAPLTCALGTAYRAVVTRGAVQAGARVAVLGIGGVGIHALQVARAVGGLAVGIDRSPGALRAARDLRLDARDAAGLDARDAAGPDARDADHPDFDARNANHPDLAARNANHPDLAATLLSESGGQGYDVVVDTVGRPATIATAARLVRPGGRIVLVGYAVDQAIELPSARMVLEEIQVVGSRYARRNELEQAIRLVAAGRVQMVVDRVLPLERADDAFGALEAGEVVGRMVLHVAGRDGVGAGNGAPRAAEATRS